MKCIITLKTTQNSKQFNSLHVLIPAHLTRKNPGYATCRKAKNIIYALRHNVDQCKKKIRITL